MEDDDDLSQWTDGTLFSYEPRDGNPADAGNVDPPGARPLDGVDVVAPGRQDGSVAGTVASAVKHAPLSYLASLLNSAPNTALGVGLALPSYLLGKVLGTGPKLQFGNNALQLLNSPLNIPFNRALTLGNIQMYPPSGGPDATVRKSYTGIPVNNGLHEEAHTYHSALLGPAYLRAEAIGAMLMGDANPMEVDADHYASGRGAPSPQPPSH